MHSPMGCARLAYGSDVTNDLLVSHQVVVRFKIQRLIEYP